MILDKQNLFSENQAITGTANSTNVIDLGSAGAAKGTNLDIVATVTESFTLLTSLAATLTTADNEAMSGAVTIATADSLTLAELVAGAQFNFGRVPDNALQYLRITYTVTGTNPDAGKITAGIIAGRK